MEKHVLSDGFARLDEVRILSRLDRKRSDWIAASRTVSRPNRIAAAVCFPATAASTGRNAEGKGDFNA